jgi:hypothetical protein
MDDISLDITPKGEAVEAWRRRVRSVPSREASRGGPAHTLRFSERAKTVASFLHRRGRLGLALIVCLLAIGLALADHSEGGLLLPSDPAPSCDTNSRQIFLPWRDASYYVLMPGGSFEGTHGWTLNGGAKVVPGNEPFYVAGRSDTGSLYLPAGSSATTPPTCFAFADWHMRFFALNSGSRYGTLEVDVIVKNLLGIVSVLDGGRISAGSQWSPSPKVSLLLTNVGGLLGTNTISLRFTPIGSNSAFRIDDVYLDPYKGG